MRNTLVKTAILLMLGAVCLVSTVSAQVLQSTIGTQNNINTEEAASQNRIDSVADETEDILNQFRQVVSETDSLKIYNAQLQRLVTNQRTELTSINGQLGQLEATDRAITPLMIDMVDTMEQIVERDVPFLLDDRRARVEDMRFLLDDPNVTVSEKYRRILEIYQGEIDFGRTTFAYDGNLPDNTKVTFLRIGRTLLIYQSLDGENTGWWNPETREFSPLASEYRLAVKDGIAIAQNRRAPNLVSLPVPAPSSAR